jgi:hypothetical protein
MSQKAIQLFERFLEWVSPKRIALLSLAGLTLIVSVTFFEHRTALLSWATKQESTTGRVKENFVELSPSIIENLKTIVTRSPKINLVAAVSADLQVNQRNIEFTYSDDQRIASVTQEFLKTRGPTSAVFTANDRQNMLMVAVINGEFACYKFDDTTLLDTVPSLKSDIPYACYMSIPPYYGEFRGYLVLGLKGSPSDAELGELRIESTRLSNKIYFKSITRRRL